ncbi:DUF643 domain-containing protein [Borreliella afzelii]|uniref:Uncharacterized protein n=2 Tax=Borreliella afzelii TaxID=29518 RepID=A0AB34Z440_BORAF|nr:hypothetical protein [Borreliella afzelii]
MFLLYYYIDNMHVNEVSDFYDNLDKETKKEIHKLYRTTQPTLGQKRRIYSTYEAIQEYKRKTGKSINEIVNDIVKPTKKFIKDVLKDKCVIDNVIDKHKNSQNIKVDFSYREEMLEECLVKLGEDKSANFLLYVHIILDNMNQEILNPEPLHVINPFIDTLFTSMHYYDKGIFTSNNLIKRIKKFLKHMEPSFIKMQ